MKHPHRYLLGLLSLFLIVSSANAISARDTWLEVRSKNFYLVGNASEKEIRKVGVKLEEFRESFRILFTGTAMTAAIPTNVVVFKSNSAFKPFKPLRPDGKTDNFVAGYFQPGEDANYIIVSTEGDDAEMFNTIFHEYVHFIVNTNFGKSEVPPWFNEGLAEYYSTFEINDDQNIKIGLPLSRHISLLQESKLIPLADLFRIGNRQLTGTGDHSRSIFYAESWALIHYLILTKKPLDKFLSEVLKGVPQDKAFKDSFQMDYSQMESELRKYVSKNTYQYTNIILKNKLDFDTGMQVAPYPEAAVSARLGDLLYHTSRDSDAEPYLLAALKLEPDMSMANTTLGMVKLRQRKFDEARQYLEKATSGDQKNPMAYYRYAYLLSRDGRDEFGMVSAFPKETAEKMRGALKKAIALAPDFGESYDLLAFIALVNNDQTDEAAALLQKAIKLQPGNEKYVIRLAELYIRQGKFDLASAIAAKYSKSDDDEIRSRASALESQINSRKTYEQQLAAYNQRRDSRSSGQESSGEPVLRKREQQKPMSEEEIAKATAEASNRSINEALRQPQAGEKRVLGTIQKIECKGASITYQISVTGAGTLALLSKDFQNLPVTSFAPGADNISIGCGVDLSALYALVTYKEPSAPKPGAKSELISLEFVPKTFRLLTEQEMNAKTQTAKVVEGSAEIISPARRDPPPAVQNSIRESMVQYIRSNIREPGAGEKRELAFLQKIECTNKGVFFNMKTSTSLLRLLNSDPRSLAIKVYAPDLGGVQFECNSSVLDFPAVVIYTDKPDSKLKTAGTILSLDFVPKNFTLN
jgi:Flp pilus assembly protein TadD, contains TPR repeats